MTSLVAELVKNFIKPANHDLFHTLTSKIEKQFEHILNKGQAKFLVNGFEFEAKFFNNIRNFMTSWQDFHYGVPSGQKRRRRETGEGNSMEKTAHWLDVISDYLNRPSLAQDSKIMTVQTEIGQSHYDVKAKFVVELINEQLVPVTNDMLMILLYTNEYHLVIDNVESVYNKFWADLKARKWVLRENCTTDVYPDT